MPEKDTKRSKHLPFRHSAMWKRFYNNVKRTTHMFEVMFIDPFDNDNPSDHPLNFMSGVNQGKLTKSLR